MRTVYLLARRGLVRRSTRLIVALICVLIIPLVTFAFGPASTGAKTSLGPKQGTCCPQFPQTATATRAQIPSPSPTPSHTPTPTHTPAPAPACQVRYSYQSQWQDGFVADVWITNTGTAAINGWTLAWMFSGNQSISSMWNAGYTQTGSGVSAHNAAWNTTIAPGAMVNLGFQASFSGTNNKPTGFTLNGRPCSVQE